MKKFFQKLSVFLKIPVKATAKFGESVGIGLLINSLYGLQTGDNKAPIILIESLLILIVVAISSISKKD